MTSEVKNSRTFGRAVFVGAVLMAVVLFLVTALVVIGSLAWTLGWIGLSLDVRFLVATMIFGSMVLATSAILLAAILTQSQGAFDLDESSPEESSPEDTNLVGREVDEEEVANRVASLILSSAIVDQYVGNRHGEELAARNRRRHTKSVGSTKRK